MLDFYINTEITVPINLVPLVNNDDYELIVDDLTYDAASLVLAWNFTSNAGVNTVTVITPAESGDYELINNGSGMYSIVIPDSGGVTINNNTVGVGWFSGYANNILAWHGPYVRIKNIYASAEPSYDGSTETEGISGLEEVSALSLYRYAKIMNINPVHLSMSGDISLDDGNVLFPLTIVDGDNYYVERPYFQSERVSREEIRDEISRAESEIEDFLGFYVAPKWTVGEKISLKEHYDPQIGYNWYNLRGERVRHFPQWGKFIAGGQRNSILLSSDVAVIYQDNDGDGWDETAVIEFELEYASTSLYEIEVFFSGYSGSPQYQIRPPLIKSKDGGTVTITFETWKMIHPAYYDAYPTNERDLINLSDSDSLVATVDIYRKYNSTSSAHAKIYYEADCDDLEYATQDGYIKLTDPELNGVQVVPADYDEDSGAWSKSQVSGNIQYITLNYYSGLQYRPTYGANFWDQLHPDLAQAIAYLATSRLSRPLAGKPATTALSRMLQDDYTNSEKGRFKYATQDVVSSPFGTRAGEVYVYRRLMHFQKKFMRYNSR